MRGAFRWTWLLTDNVPRLLTASSGVTLTSTSASFNGGTRHVRERRSWKSTFRTIPVRDRASWKA